ncbi:hypothetical protein MLD38_019861 [Melastoma candidum]|uniref:Uncharacterized protein n=1 Tax=Melastoma candidum TaxID=119954 RepID=A0ACB9QAW1_9MYRT|nr:hypothetical protein MLD38_019861 [Melastoma candidum]
MYAETGLMFPCFHHNLSLEESPDFFCKSNKPHISQVSLSDLTRASSSSSTTIAEYDLGGEGDLFKAPEPIIEEPIMVIDPMTAAISMMSGGQYVVLPPGLKFPDIVSLQNEPLFSDFYYECGKDLMEKEAVNAALLDEAILEGKILPLTIDEKEPLKDEMPLDMTFSGTQFQKSVSSECLNSMDWVQGASPMKPSFLDFPILELGAAFGMRRAYSEGDIKTLSNSNERPMMIVGNCTVEERWEKLSRYRNKKTKRNFGRKIKYACRKALADSQPRIRGRFARTDEIEDCKRP